MKKLYLLLFFVPLFLAFQCEEDEVPGFDTNYIIQNDASVTVFYATISNQFIEIEPDDTLIIGNDRNPNAEALLPSDNLFLTDGLRIYIQQDENFIQVYQQQPINDAAWTLLEPTQNFFEYRFIITDALLD